MHPDIRHRLTNFSEVPPASAWQRIADRLDTPAYAQKLYNFETAPPAAAWEQIQKKVAGTEAKIVPLRTKLFKYAIAAAVLGAIAAGSIFYLTDGTTNLATTQPQRDASDHATKEALLNTPPQHTPKNEAAENENDELNSSAGLKENGMASNRVVHFSSRVRVSNKALAANQITVSPEEKAGIDTELPNRYIIATTASGKVVRLPKKAYSDYACAERFQNNLCKEKIAAIQSKVAASVATDFTDFMDLLKKLQDN